MKKIFEKIFRLPLEGKLSPRVTDEVENTPNEKHLIRQVNLTPSPRGEGSRRGFTLVELVIALTMIVLVTGVSIGVVMVNTNTHAETIDMIEATNIAENAVECFRFAVNNGGYDQPSFNELFSKSFDSVKKENVAISCNGKEEYQEETLVFQTDTYTVTDGRITVTIVISNSISGGKFDTITITATNNGTNEHLIERVTYRVR